MNTARLNQGTPLLLNGVTKRYGRQHHSECNWICIFLPDSLWPLSAAAVVAKVPCCACWQVWKRQPAGDVSSGHHTAGSRFRMIRE